MVAAEEKSVAKSQKDIVGSLRAMDERMVKGTFVYRAKPGGRYRSALRKYKRGAGSTNAQGFVHINMVDGEDYTVPLWVAKWLNAEEDNLACADFRHENNVIIDIENEHRPAPKRTPVFRFIIKEFV